MTRFFFLFAALLFAIPAVQGAGFLPTGAMTDRRFVAVTTLLPSGKVLATGGAVTSNHRASSEIYDPAKGIWEATGDMTTACYGHATVVLTNGKVLVTGGVTPFSVPLSNAQIYETKFGIWYDGSAMAVKRAGHTLTLLPNGRVLAVGGVRSGNVPTLTEYCNAVGSVWTTTGPTNVARQGHTATLLKNGKVLVAGGNDQDTSFSSTEIYDPAKGTWTPAADMKVSRGGHVATLLLDGRVLVTGGYSEIEPYNLDSAEIYDPVDNSWTLVGHMSTDRYVHTATLLPHGKVLVIGGANHDQQALASADLYDPATNTWSPAGNMSTKRYNHAATLLRSGDVLISGGEDEAYNYFASSELYGLGDIHGSYSGLVTASNTTIPGVATEGSLTATVQVTRDFTGKLLLDGQTLSLAGKFDEEGNARLGAAGVTALVIERTNRPSFTVSLHIERQGPAGERKLLGTVTRMYRAAVVAVSNVDASPAFYDGKTPATTVPPAYLANLNADGVYHIILPSMPLVSQPAGFTLADYPQGTGYGSGKITKAGAVTLSGKLADGTAFSFASTVAVRTTQVGPTITALTVPLFNQLYGGLGFISATVGLDNTNLQSDFAALAPVKWAKPFQNIQWYPYGWPEVIVTGLSGSKYTVTPGQSVVPGITPPAVGNPGNAYLDMSQGLLASHFSRGLVLSNADVVTKLDIHDTSYSLTVTRSTGAIAGVFAHSDSTKPAYQGIIYQKGSLAGGHGYFLTTAPKVRNYLGQGGLVKLTVP